MTTRRLSALALLAGLLCASTAYAQDPDQEDPEPEVSDAGPEEPTNPYERLLAVSVTGGLDTPLGVVGAAVEFAPVEFFNIYAGGGVSRDGARVAGGLSLRFPVHSTAFGFMAGVAGGPISWEGHFDDNGLGVHRYWEFAMFVHAAAFCEYRWDIGVFGRLQLGSEALVAGDLTECNSAGGGACDESREHLLNPIRAWVGLSIGYAFEL